MKKHNSECLFISWIKQNMSIDTISEYILTSVDEQLMLGFYHMN